MRASDAPPAGWYPDPESRTSLRWWDGLDWSDIRRAPPSNAELTRYESAHPESPRHLPPPDTARAGATTVETERIIAGVRDVARSEVDRAARQFTQRAESAVRGFTPLITEYSNKVLRWIRFAAIAATVLLVGWFVVQVILQASLFEWIGDRVDNLTNNDKNGAALPFLRAFTGLV